MIENKKLKFTKVQMILEIIAVILLIAMYVYLFINWQAIPDLIPGHYNAAGEVNRWGSKNELYILPIITTVFYTVFTAIEFFPTIWNIPVNVNDKNRTKVYSSVRTLLILVKVEFIANFFYINFNSMKVKPLPTAFLPIMLVIVFGTIAFFMVSLVRSSKG